MTRILLVGYDPDTEDFSDPSHPPGASAETIKAGIETGLRRMRERGWLVDVCLIPFEETPAAVHRRTREGASAAAYDCVVLGGGIRLPSNHLVLEAVLNAVHRAAPGAVIALNAGPDDSADAAERALEAATRPPSAM